LRQAWEQEEEIVDIFIDLCAGICAGKIIPSRFSSTIPRLFDPCRGYSAWNILFNRSIQWPALEILIPKSADTTHPVSCLNKATIG
jgi:hypothetical protein